MTSSKQKAIGFTLIELLVVIAVIGILAAILIPTLSAARQRGNLTKSIANARSIGQATLLYAQSNKSNYPVWHNYTTAQYWWQALRDYLGEDNEVFHSPAHEEFDATDDNTIAATISYGWNYTVMGRHIGDTSKTGDYVLNQFSLDPANTLILTDSTRTDSYGYIDATGHNADADRYGNNQTVAVFLDGRASVMSVDLFTVEDPYFLPSKALPDDL
jgi:general secretion pathway protein G